ncbi:NAD(+) diphosphatase [Nocardioides zeae]|uniref:NAD(+) diphosphatase n=1 Tax=Nocardioides imazamoxiresistens TaxID=3231893 RepID=A0ABU3PY07_9ACTN|nr:NAD(+) diphosphatase [Nocardioides zeae]MDT9593766.1 NAD(+) diphosphatase [Nocardioides zeae]
MPATPSPTNPDVGADLERRDPAQRQLPHVAMSAYAHDRHGLERTDADWLAREWDAPGTRVLPIAGNRMLVRDGAPAWLPVAELPEAAAGAEAVRVLLGERDGATYFAALFDPALAPQPGDGWQGLRPVLEGVLAEERGPLAFHAMGLAEWHWATRFCPRCGRGLTASHAGHVLRCASPEGCGRQQFPRTDPAVIMLVTDGEPGAEDERCLLGHATAWPEGRYSTLAGFVEPGETFEDAVRREVAEEAGVVVGEVTYFGNQPWPLPASVMIGFTARVARTEGADVIDVDGAEIADARWFTRADIRRGVADGSLLLPGAVSISHSLVQSWFGEALDTRW